MIYTKKDIQEQINKKSNNTVIIIGDYISTNYNTKLICSVCNHEWEVLVRSYLQNKTVCPNCNSNKGGRITQDEVKNRIKIILGDEYELLGLYTGKRNKITLKHSCGNIYQVWPNDIWQKHLGECLICKDSFSLGHKTIRNFLKNYVVFTEEKTFDNCVGITGVKLPFDFFIPIFNLVIEFDGEQHFKPKWSEDEFKRTKRNDLIKNKYCADNDINLLRISFKEIKSIELILEKTFNDYRKGND